MTPFNKINIKLLTYLGAHIGHAKIDWNTLNTAYLVGTTNNNYLIFNINKTYYYLKRSSNFMRLLGYNNGTFVIYYPGDMPLYKLMIEGVFDKEGLIPSRYPFVHSIVKPGFFSNWRTNYKLLLKQFYKVIYWNPFFFGGEIIKQLYKKVDKSTFKHGIQQRGLISSTFNISPYFRLFTRGLRIYRKISKVHPNYLKDPKLIIRRTLKKKMKTNKSNELTHTSKHSTNFPYYKKTHYNKLGVVNKYLYNTIFENISLENYKKDSLVSLKQHHLEYNHIKRLLLKLNQDYRAEKRQLRLDHLKILYYNIYNMILMISLRQQKYNNNNDSLTPYEQHYFRRFVKFLLVFRYLKRIQSIPSSIILLNPANHDSQATDFQHLNSSLIGITDSNSSYKSLSYYIPSNDDNIILLIYYMKLLGESFTQGRKEYVLQNMSNRFMNNLCINAHYNTPGLFIKRKDHIENRLFTPFFSTLQQKHIERLKEKDMLYLKQQSIYKNRKYRFNKKYKRT